MPNRISSDYLESENHRTEGLLPPEHRRKPVMRQTKPSGILEIKPVQRKCKHLSTKTQDFLLSQRIPGKCLYRNVLNINHDSYLLYPLYVTVYFLTSISPLTSVVDRLSNNRQKNPSASGRHRYPSLDSRLLFLLFTCA